MASEAQVVQVPVEGLNGITSIPNPFANLVCGGANDLADGRAVSIGGGGLSGPGVNSVTAFATGSSNWTALAPTNYTTWYASSTVLGDGRLLRLGGVNGCNSCNPENAEIYDPATDTWSILSGTTTLLPMYPFTFLRPDGTVALTGASEVTSVLRILDPVTQTHGASAMPTSSMAPHRPCTTSARSSRLVPRPTRVMPAPRSIRPTSRT